jgi:hypothetical protein
LLYSAGTIFVNYSKNYDINPDDISITLYSFAKLKFRNDTIYQQLAGQLQLRNVSMFSAQNLTNIMQALAAYQLMMNDNNNITMTNTATGSVLSSSSSKKEVRNDPVLLQCCAIIAQEFIKRSYEFKPNEISSLCRSFAVLGVKDAQFLTSVEQELTSRINNNNNKNTIHDDNNAMTTFNGQNIANILWQVLFMLGFKSHLYRIFGVFFSHNFVVVFFLKIPVYFLHRPPDV